MIAQGVFRQLFSVSRRGLRNYFPLRAGVRGNIFSFAHTERLLLWQVHRRLTYSQDETQPWLTLKGPPFSASKSGHRSLRTVRTVLACSHGQRHGQCNTARPKASRDAGRVLCTLYMCVGRTVYDAYYSSQRSRSDSPSPQRQAAAAE